MSTLLIDNFDSFTWNVFQALEECNAKVVVKRNNEITLEEAIALKPKNLVISPGMKILIIILLVLIIILLVLIIILLIILMMLILMMLMMLFPNSVV